MSCSQRPHRAKGGGGAARGVAVVPDLQARWPERRVQAEGARPDFLHLAGKAGRAHAGLPSTPGVLDLLLSPPPESKAFGERRSAPAGWAIC